MNVNSLSYHLGFAILQLIREESNIHHRLNLIVFIKSCVKAMSKNVDIKEVEKDLRILRDTYEPELDISEYTYVKRAKFEIALDEAQESLLEIINEKGLVSQSVMAEIIAGKWSNEKSESLAKKASKRISE